MEEFNPCPKCGGTNLHAYAFSVSIDAGVRCLDCEYEYETEVPWEDGVEEEEHDEACRETLKSEWNNLVLPKEGRIDGKA